MEVWHVRHGERADEVTGREKACWKKTTIFREGRYYDPPLTRFGHVQASTAGRYLNSLPFNKSSDRETSGFDRVYTSPLIRAVQTAYCISHEFGGLPIQVVPGLCACTAAVVRFGFANVMLMNDDDIRDAFPDANLLPRDPLAPISFDGACFWLASQSRERILAVGHREGTKGMAGRRVPTPHCCIGVFRPSSAAPLSFVLERLLSRMGRPLEHKSDELVNEEDFEAHDAGWYTREPSSSDGFLTGDRWLRNGRQGKLTMLSDTDRSPSSRHLQDYPGKGVGSDSMRKSVRNTSCDSTMDSSSSSCGSLGERGLRLKNSGATGRGSGSSTYARRGPSVATLSRELPPVSRKHLHLLDLPPDALWGSTGVLSYLDPRELCLAKMISKRWSPAVENDHLWRAIFLQLREMLRREQMMTSGCNRHAGAPLPTQGNYKTRFVRIITSGIASRSLRAARKIARERRRLGVVHGLRRAVEVLEATLKICLNGKDVRLVDSIGTRREGWASRANILTEPSSRRGMRLFSLSSSMKIDVPPAMSFVHFHSIDVLLERCGLSWLSTPVFKVNHPLLLQRRRVLGTSIDGLLTLLEIPCGSSETTGGSHTVARETRGTIMVGVLGDAGVNGEHIDGEVCLMTLHMPHQLILDSWTRKMQNHGGGSQRNDHDSAGALRGLENLGAALGLKTAAVPLWETSSIGVVTGTFSRQSTMRFGETPSSGVYLKPLADRRVLRLDLVSPGAGGVGGALGEARSLGAEPSMPFITTGGLSGVVEGVLLADFALFDCHGDSLWSFTSPIVFEAAPPGSRHQAGAREGYVVDISHSEIVEERRRGLVEEGGVGRVIIELALVGLSSLRTGHEWIVRSAWVELELEFFRGQFGTEHSGRQAQPTTWS